MIPAQLHAKLMEACQDGNLDDVKHWLDQGAEPNFNIKLPLNALNAALQRDNHQMIELLLEHGAIVKEFVLQQALEKDKNYLHLLIPSFSTCKDQNLLMGVLQAATNIDDLDLAKHAINQGAKPASLYLNAVRNLSSPELLRLLIENDFDIHAEKNILLTEWMGSSLMGQRNWKAIKYDLMAFICEYYLEKPKSIEKFKSWSQSEKLRLFGEGLGSHNFIMMKFAILIGANENEALNSALNRYYEKSQGSMSSTPSTMLKSHKSSKSDHGIIEYILNSNITFNKVTISNAVCFKYSELLHALSRIDDLEYAYEMAYKYEDDALCDYFIDRGVSKEAQSSAKIKVSAIKGNIKALHQAVNEGTDLQMLDTGFIVEVINENQLESLKYLYDLGLLVDTSLNVCLDKAMSYYKAYETISFLIEIGLDITCIKNISRPYKKKYPALFDMWEMRFSDIFDYTIYLAKEVHPNAQGKEKEEILQRIAQLSSLPYVIKMSQEKSLEH